MPKSQLDWLGVVSLWLGTAIMALKAADFALIEGAPIWLAANWWNYVPVALVTFYVVVAIRRKLQRHDSRPEAGPERGIDPASKAVPARESQDRGERRERQGVIQALDTVHYSARHAMADVLPSARQRTAERQLPEIRAAMLSAHKLFGTPIPPEGGEAQTELELHCRMIEEMLPYIRKGHVEEGRDKAQAFLVKINDLLG